MSNSITKWIFITILSFLINPDVLIQGQRQVPCLFFFGDSLFENGNNNDLITVARSNYPPYGIDYPGGLATGRPTNGRNLANFLGIFFVLYSTYTRSFIFNIFHYVFKIDSDSVALYYYIYLSL